MFISSMFVFQTAVLVIGEMAGQTIDKTIPALKEGHDDTLIALAV